ncbi:type IV pilin protein [Candidatus Avelusimicrobium alvi]|jgi:prepilin-type N-terminal cleavage/methylation domain-containing protein|uniref:type IV pilin protein n=1 Tax=Candidatus Avelusimicrobium alvi TaxID=3416221 RepID=UPI003D0F2997
MNRYQSGFTLVELLAVVLIIAVLTSVALPQYRRSVHRAEAMEALVNLKTLFDSAKRYRSANSEAPLKLNGLDVSFFDADTPDASTFNIGKFKYLFYTDRISACRISGTGASTYSDTYCLVMSYKRDIGGTTYKDLLVCNSGSSKWKHVCESLAQTCSDGTASKTGDSYIISDKICN